MSYAFQTPVGRPVEACPTADIPAIGPDKWQILSALTDAADRFGLSHRPLCVLRALLTFLPERHIPEGTRAIVFPANRTLSDRLGGMPESTLRRHLATLVKTGIVSRHDSPNRKRYAKRVKGGIALAFGIDLAPLVKKARAILVAAAEAQESAERLQILRARVIALRHDLRAQDTTGQADALCNDIQKSLRRKLTETDLKTCLFSLEQALNTIVQTKDDNQDTNKMSGNDTQNERHIQGKEIINSDSEAHPTQAQSEQEGFALERKRLPCSQAEISLQDVIDTCPGFQCFFPEPVRTWRQLDDIASRLAPMMGIDQPVLSDARKRMGCIPSIVAVLYIHERLSEIKSPGGYLRHLSQNASPQGFNVAPMLAKCRAGELSADNSERI
jgi:replication initiation protein RepC